MDSITLAHEEAEDQRDTKSPVDHSAANSIAEKGDSYTDAFPDGGRGWLVVLGCFIFSTVTVGWG